MGERRRKMRALIVFCVVVAMTVNAMKPETLADIMVYDSEGKGCSGSPGNIGPCITSDEGKFVKELYMCDKAGQLLIARCVDEHCKKCTNVRKDDYGYGSPAQCCKQDLKDIFCKDDFLKAKCTDEPVGNRIRAHDEL